MLHCLSLHVQSDSDALVDVDKATDNGYSSSPFAIKRRMEFGYMAELFLGVKGRLLFYAIMVVYLYGDLTIYAVSVPLTLADYTGTFHIGGLEFEDPYRAYVILFALLVGPFCFFDFQVISLLPVAFLPLIITNNICNRAQLGCNIPPWPHATLPLWQ